MNNILKEADALIDKGGSRFESAKQKLSQAIEAGSEKLIAGAEAIEGTALSSAESLLDGAAYLRNRPGGKILQDCSLLCKKYPLQAMTAAAIAGLFLGKSIWGKKHA